MDKRVIFQASALGAATAFVAVLVMAIASFSVGSDVNLQPGSVPVPVEDFVRPTNEYTGTVLGFFGGDSLFILSYLLVFVGLYVVTAERARPFALLGLAAGVLTALFDAAENAFLITYALSARNGMPLTTPDLPLVYILANLKWMAAFATLYAFGAVFPRRTRVEWVILVLSLVFPLVGVLGVANPPLVAARGLFSWRGCRFLRGISGTNRALSSMYQHRKVIA
jgi:hypothetical protein